MKMKVLALALSSVLAMSALAGCQTATPTPAAPVSEAPAEPSAPAEPAAPVADGTQVRTALGIITSVASSKSATADAAGTAQVDSTVVALTLDADGVIVDAAIDSAQTKIPVDAAGAIAIDGVDVRSKDELGTEYGMQGASGIGKEWNEQAAAFASYAVGKKVTDISGITLVESEPGHMVAESPDLATSVTISLVDFIDAFEEAAARQTPSAAASGTIKTGLGIVTGVGSSKSATADAAGTAQVDSTIAAVAVDANGVIVNCAIDSAQTKVPVDAKGVVTVDGVDLRSKLELGADYGMKNASGIGKEWNEQADAFAAFAVGKTVADLKGITLVEKDGHMVADNADLAASVTVSVADFITAVEKAVTNAN